MRIIKAGIPEGEKVETCPKCSTAFAYLESSDTSIIKTPGLRRIVKCPVCSYAIEVSLNLKSSAPGKSL